MVGPVLLKQDKAEAVMSVDGRLQYIEKEIGRVEKLIADIQEKSEQKKMEVRTRIWTAGIILMTILDLHFTDSDAARAATSSDSIVVEAPNFATEKTPNEAFER